MGSGDREDPREMAALREEAENEYTGAWDERYVILAEQEHLTQEEEYKLGQLLSVFEKELVREVSENGIAFFAVKTALLAAKRVQTDTNSKYAEALQRLGSVSGPATDEKFERLGRDPIIVKDILSEFRTHAVLARQQGREKEFLARVKKDWLTFVVTELAVVGEQLPETKDYQDFQSYWQAVREVRQSLERTAGPLGIEILKHEEGPLIDKLTKKGTHPKFAERYARNVLIERLGLSNKDITDQATRVDEVSRLASGYSKPDKLVEKIFDLQDGKLPV